MEAPHKPWDIDLTVYNTEQELLDGLRRRDRVACTCLLKQYMPRLYRMAVQVTGDPQEAEDALQEAFIQACSKVDTFQAEGSLGTWLYRIVLNSALTHLRRRKPPTVSIDEPHDYTGDRGPSPALDLPDTGRSPGEQLLSRELRETIDDAILQLPDSLRAAFVLRDVEGLSTAEAAETLGITESALKVRLHRARIALRESLTPYIHDAHDRNGDGRASRPGERDER